MKLKVRDAMSTEVRCVRSSVPLPDLERRLNAERTEYFAVVDDGVFRGQVSLQDILRKLDVERAAAETATGFWDEGGGLDSPLPASEWVSEIVGKHMDHMLVNDVLNRNAIRVSPDASLIEVARTMKQQTAHRAFVIDDHQAVIGVLTSFDFLRMYADGRL